MRHRSRLTVAAPALVTLWAIALLSPLDAQLDERFRSWNQPVEPLRIHGNLYYVGASDIASYLVTTPAGHILIDGGFQETVPIITSGIEKLGFRLEEVEILLHSHAHFDHVAGLAELKRLTGARLLASRRDAPVLESGGLGDPLLGDSAPFPAVDVDRLLDDGDTVELGGQVLTARVTAGHTQGCTTWVMEIEGRLAVSICSVTVLPGLRFSDPPTYPGVAADYRRTFEVLESLPAEIFLASHASFFDLAGKRARLDEEANPFVDPEGYRAFVERGKKRFLEALASQEE